MSFLPRKYALGAQLPTGAAASLLDQRQRMQQSGQQAQQLASSALGLLPGGAVAAGALQAIGATGTAIGNLAKDENGLYKNNSVGTRLAASAEMALNPLKGISALAGVLTGKRKLNDFYGIKADQQLRQKLEAEQNQQSVLQAEQAGKQLYAGLLRRGGQLLPGARSYAGGGQTPPAQKKPAPQPVVGNPAQAQQYYQNVLPTVAGLLKSKYDETYTDPQTGKTCTANSCLSFATTALEKATGMPRQERTKANLYNPEFTRTSEQQGWVRIPLGEAKAGDRLQYWNAEGNVANGVDRTADLGGRQYIQGKYPSHMMVFGGWKDEQDAQGRRNAVVYNDGHEFSQADRDIRTGVGDDSYVAYRFVGINGQPTNNPQEAVAPALATQPGAARPAGRTVAVVTRKKGGLLPDTKAESTRSVIAHGALHSEKNNLRHKSAGKRGIPVLAADGTKLAEVERDELTLHKGVTDQVEALRDEHHQNGGKPATLRKLGRLLAQEITTNTTPSPRYAKRLGK